MIAEALAEELVVIEAIYPGQVSLVEGSESTCLLNVPDSGVTLYLSFDQDYPLTSPKVSGVSATERQRYQETIDELSGSEVLFSLLSSIHDAPVTDSSPGPAEAEAGKSSDEVTCIVEWACSDALQDRKSTFIGRACRVSCESELQAALSSVEAKRATHPRIWACRYRDVVTDRLVQENDDDGESAAGGRLAFLLEVTKAEDVLVVVSRWFGGVLLGDIRFKHISTVAREALDRGGFLQQDPTRKPAKTK